eukprot:EG_transcript_13999
MAGGFCLAGLVAHPSNAGLHALMPSATSVGQQRLVRSATSSPVASPSLQPLRTEWLPWPKLRKHLMHAGAAPSSHPFAVPDRTTGTAEWLAKAAVWAMACGGVLGGLRGWWRRRSGFAPPLRMVCLGARSKSAPKTAGQPQVRLGRSEGFPPLPALYAMPPDFDSSAAASPSSSTPLRLAVQTFGVGAVLGTLADALHNQAVLVYDYLPITFQLTPSIAIATSAVVPPLLGATYAVLGVALPRLVRPRLPPDGPPPWPKMGPVPRAALAWAAMSGVLRLSSVLIASPFPLPLCLALLQCASVGVWCTLDRRRSSLAIALLVSLGPLAELPFMAAGAWHYLQPDVHVLPGLPGLLSLTFPCYFVTAVVAILTAEAVASKTRRDPG